MPNLKLPTIIIILYGTQVRNVYLLIIITVPGTLYSFRHQVGYDLTTALTAPKTQMTNMLMKKEMARAMVDSMELYLMPSLTSTGSLREMARL